ncbi:unnamed protein product [Cuscuta europaea]|uniref:Amine oxidase domain-containing protein n=2 Tax=Cuscuta europaea TaxID=41803 RepID=A0A9P1EBD9_CUSEU|nr:unnamed protein product [Cuscuta europaea]
MESPVRCSVIIVGAGISGITAAKVLALNGVEDVLILEAADRIGGRLRKEDFCGVTVELGAGWVAGVGGKQSNPVWELARQSDLRTCFSDYSCARYNIYDRSGKIFPSGIAADSYQKAVDSAIHKLRRQQANPDSTDSEVANISESIPSTPIELAIDFILHDFEMAEVEPIPTYVNFGEREYLVADERGYEHLLYKMAATFLSTSDGKIVDTRVKLNTVVREVQQHTRNDVSVTTEDGIVYEASYIVLSVSIGVLQSDLISFTPPLPTWKTEAFQNCDIMVYTKIFLKFPYRFWPCGPGKEFFIYAHERRGYYTFWQHMDNAYPGSNILVVTLTNEESKRVEAQTDGETLKEAMDVLRNMFGAHIPTAIDIVVPRWWNNRFQRGSYSNYPIYGNHQLVRNLKAPVGRVFFTGEHTNEKFNGYVHGGYFSGIDTCKALLEEMRKEGKGGESQDLLLLDPLIALRVTEADDVSGLHKCDIPRRELFLGSTKHGLPEAIL